MNQAEPDSNEIVMNFILETLRAAPFTGTIVLHVNSSVIRKHERVDSETIKARREVLAGRMVTTASLLEKSQLEGSR